MKRLLVYRVDKGTPRTEYAARKADFDGRMQRVFLQRDKCKGAVTRVRKEILLPKIKEVILRIFLDDGKKSLTECETTLTVISKKIKEDTKGAMENLSMYKAKLLLPSDKNQKTDPISNDVDRFVKKLTSLRARYLRACEAHSEAMDLLVTAENFFMDRGWVEHDQYASTFRLHDKSTKVPDEIMQEFKGMKCFEGQKKNRVDWVFKELLKDGVLSDLIKEQTAVRHCMLRIQQTLNTFLEKVKKELIQTMKGDELDKIRDVLCDATFSYKIDPKSIKAYMLKDLHVVETKKNVLLNVPLPPLHLDTPPIAVETATAASSAHLCAGLRAALGVGQLQG